MAGKEGEKMMRIIIYSVLVFLAVVPMIVGFISFGFGTAGLSSLSFGLATGVMLWGVFILQGLRRIPAKPPHKALVTLFGERQFKEIEERSITVREAIYKNEGWRFFPLYPYWYGYIRIKVERISFIVVAEKVRTPDRANSKIPIFLTIRPSSQKLIEYINSGEEEGAKSQLTGKIQERVREWAMADEEGPADWKELNKSRLEAVSVLITTIARNYLTQIPEYAQQVPTFIWLRYYSMPRPKKFFQNEKKWAEDDWAKVNEAVGYIRGELGQEAVKTLQEAIRKRRSEIESLRVGTGNILIEDLGVVLERLNIGDIDVLGGVGEQAEKEAREAEEREGEALELKHVGARIQELMQPPFNYTQEQALEIVQTERGKVTKTIEEKKFSIAPETRGLVEKVAEKVIGRFGKGGT